MSKRMLIDASHPEETRVVVVDGQKVEEFDFEAASKRPLKGNIYLAKVTRVEPSLQAAFVEYGGNRQGFLAFSEIHPDYYQIPVADRQALLAEQEAEARRQAEREDAEDDAAAEAASGKPAEAVAETTDGVEGAPPIAEDGEAVFVETAEEVVTTGGDAAADSVDENGEPEDLQVATPENPGSDEDDYFPPADRHAENDEEFRASVSDEADDEVRETLSPAVDPAEEIREGIVDEQGAANAEFVAAARSDEPDNESEAVHEGLGEDTDGEAPGGVDPTEEIREGIVDEQAAANVPMSDIAAEQETTETRPLRGPKPSQRWVRRRHYKIQEVIKRKQIILVQVVKEERGNKGAALTTYLSLAGRYCVLMPNTPRGGGISRKITSASDRKRLKDAVQGLELPEGMGLIIRTAGENRTKVEIKRDYEYLLRMWDTIRETTLKSNAPACVYEEGDLIKRVIRDLYNKDVSEVVVEGDDGYRNAKDFMRMLMPSHAKNVKPYREQMPLFQRLHVDAQLDAMFQPTVNLKSGGYIVINQTEALVSIDVNSGRATREHSIEETAHKTNLEAADEIARQLRLRDLAGLIVIDFIDMEEHRNDRAVEKRLYNALKNDRARIQIGKISQFGLLEMSRQRLRAGVIAGSTVPCPHCAGQGIVRSVELTALRVLRAVEDEAQKLKASAIVVKVPADVAIYTLNQKRRELARVEHDYGMTVTFEPDERIVAGNFEIERTTQRSPDDKPRIATLEQAPVTIEEEPEEEVFEDEVEEVQEEIEAETAVVAETEQPQRPQGQPNGGSHGSGSRSRRRRGGRGRSGSSSNSGSRDHHGGQNQQNRVSEQNGHGEGHELHAEAPAGEMQDGGETAEPAAERSLQQQQHHHGGPQNGSQPGGPGQASSSGRRRRRRGRRGRGSSSAGPIPYQGDGVPVDGSVRDTAEGGDLDAVQPNTESAPVWSLTPQASSEVQSEPATTRPVSDDVEPAPEPALRSSTPVAAEPELEAVSGAEPAAASPAAPAEPSGPPRKGWWQRTFNRSE